MVPIACTLRDLSIRGAGFICPFDASLVERFREETIACVIHFRGAKITMAAKIAQLSTISRRTMRLGIKFIDRTSNAPAASAPAAGTAATGTAAAGVAAAGAATAPAEVASNAPSPFAGVEKVVQELERQRSLRRVRPALRGDDASQRR